MMNTLLVDDSRSFRDRVKRQLSESSAVTVVGEASDGAEALSLVRSLMPELLLLDLAMPVIDGFHVLREVKELFPAVKVVVLTSDASDLVRHRCTALGADGVIDKGDAVAELLPALETFTMPGDQAAGACAIAHDISEHKKAVQDLDTILALSPDMIVTANFDGYFTRINPAVTRALGYTEDELLRSPILSFVHPDDREATAAEQLRVRHGQITVGFTNRYRTSAGSYRCLEWHVRGDPVARRVYAVARDQTDRRQLEDQLRQAQKMEAVGRLAGGVAHDFNNLLTAILGFAELALDTLPADAPARADIDEIVGAGRSAAGLTRQLLAFSRKQILEPTVLDVNELIDRTQSLLRRVIGEDIRLETSNPRAECRVYADRSQLEQVLMNLAVNARDAMPSGGKLRLTTELVDLDDAFVAAHPGSQRGRHACLAMTDTGVGMAPEVVARIFEPFFTTKAAGHGTGLGLATVYGIVKQSGGYIWAESEVGRGTSLKLVLPIVDAPLEASEESAGPRAACGTETILIVEDQVEVRSALRQMLDRHGYRVLEACDGPTALALLAEGATHVDLLLTDVIMPHMGGRTLAEAVSASGRTVAVLYMSGYTADAIVRHGVLEPGIDLIHKPFGPSQLLGQVREALDRGRRAS